MKTVSSKLYYPTDLAEAFMARVLTPGLSIAVPGLTVPPEPVETTTSESLQPSQVGMGRLLVRLRAECPLLDRHPGNDPAHAFRSYGGSLAGIAGTVEGLMHNVQEYKVGDAVFGLVATRPVRDSDEVAIITPSSLARMPARLGFVGAASFAVVAVSAWQMLFKLGRLDAGETVLILGADTRIGQLATQLAVLHGVRVIALTSSPGKERELLNQGADRVIDAGAGRLEKQCGYASVVVDTLGGEVQSRASASIQAGCTLVSCIERPDAFVAARRGTRSLLFVPDVATHCLARVSCLVDGGFLNPGTVSSEANHD